jgi:hypothetical protein
VLSVFLYSSLVLQQSLLISLAFDPSNSQSQQGFAQIHILYVQI